LFTRRWVGASVHDASPIVLFHDSLGSVDQWRDFPAKLAETTNRPVIAYDRLGFGRSDPHPGALQLDFIVDESRSGLAFLRDAFELKRMVLLGHSVGGGMAVAGAAAYAADTEAVITMSAQAFVEDRTVAGILEAKAAFQAEEQMRRLAKYHGDKAAWVLGAWTTTWLSPSFADWSLDDQLTGVRCPILALHGNEDEYGTCAHPDRIAALSGGRAEIVLMKGVRHVPYREKPADVLQATRRFLEAL
jgi:pimeloyl-ACP methyl ester carboxylesterase